MAKSKKGCKDLYFDIANLDLFEAEFKHHKNCREDLARPKKSKKESETYPYFGDFDAVLSQIEHNVLGMNHFIIMSSAVQVFFHGKNRMNIDDETYGKRKQRLKKKSIDHYGNIIVFLHSKNASDVTVNFINLSNN